MSYITPLPKRHGSTGPMFALAALIALLVLLVPNHKKAPLRPHVAPHPKVAIAAVVVAPEPAKEITAVVGYDEKLTARVHVPVAGWLVEVKRASKTVRRGDPLATLYSTEVVAAERALIAELAQFTTQDKLDTARNRLVRFGMPKDWIQRVEQTGTPRGILPVWAWAGGTVVARDMIAGQFVEPSRTLITITDPAKLWVLAEVPETTPVGVGVPAKLFIEGQPKPVVAKIAYVYSRVYAGMRTVRFELVNPGTTKPETPVRIELDLASS